MKVVYSHVHQRHRPGEVIENGVARASRDVPERVDRLLAAARRAGHDLIQGWDHGIEPLADAHTAEYLKFLSGAYAEWRCAGLPGKVIPAAFGAQLNHRSDWSVVARAGYYLRDQLTPIDEGTWPAAYWAAQTALSAASLLKAGEREAYAVCRPSGHHAGRGFGGGATYLNNAAIAAKMLAKSGERLAIVDVDVHHGNGTQDIFWDDPEILFASVHRDPSSYYPHFTGFADETGGAAAPKTNVNRPLMQGSGNEAFLEGLRDCLNAVAGHSPGTLVVSLGFDALADDPAKGLLVSADAFEAAGRMFGALKMPVLFVQEGGYHLAGIEAAAANFLEGFGRSREAT